MEYMILINEPQDIQTPAPGTPGFDEYMGGWMAYNQKLIDGGHFISSARLLPSTTATTLRRVAGADSVTDGPFAETKEQLGGYYLISASDLDEALDLAKAMPMDNASIEVRPVQFRPEAL